MNYNNATEAYISVLRSADSKNRQTFLHLERVSNAVIKK